MARLLLSGFLRPGSQVYARENGSLRPRDAPSQTRRVRGPRVTLDYPGKGGKHQLREIEDAAAARVVRALLADPGPEVFRYRNGGDDWVNVRRRNLNAYLSEITGGRITAKDFRTWAGTLFGACALARSGFPDPADGAGVSSGASRRRCARRRRSSATRPRSVGRLTSAPESSKRYERGECWPNLPLWRALDPASPRVLGRRREASRPADRQRELTPPATVRLLFEPRPNRIDRT